MDFKTRPYDHQLEAFEASKDRSHFAYFMEQGTGKTKVVIDNAAYLYEAGKITSLLVIAPKSVYINWVTREIPVHMPDVEYHAQYWTGKRSEKAKGELRAFPLGTGLRVFTINIDAVNTEFGFNFCQYFIKNSKAMVVIDESTRIKNRRAKRTKRVHNLGLLAPYRRIMTGTPVTQSPFDVYSQMQFLNPSILGFRSYHAFTHHFAIMDRQVGRANGRQYRYETVREFRNLDQLHKLLKPHSYRCLKRDCLDLPDKIYQVRDLHLSGDQLRAYRQMKSELLLEFDSETVSAKMKLTLVGKLHQIVGGFSLTDSGSSYRYDNNVKLEALKDIMEDASLPCIIWAKYVEEIRMIGQAIGELGLTVATFYGETNQNDREIAINDFQDGYLDVLVMNPAAGGMGITLTRGETVIYYSNGYEYESRIQSEDRVHRSGLRHPVTYIDLVCRQTIDQAILKSLRQKRSFSDVVTKDAPSEWLGGE